MDLSEILLWIAIGGMLLAFAVKGMASGDTPTAVLAHVAVGAALVGGGAFGIVYGLGAALGWW
jgi:hypothetical protein